MEDVLTNSVPDVSGENPSNNPSPDGVPGADPQQSGKQQGQIRRDVGDITDERRANVANWHREIRADKDYFKPEFKQMRLDMEMARLGADGQWVEGGNYVVAIVQRHINRAVATLYAKNPTAEAKRRKKLWFKIWDGKAESLMAAMQAAPMGDPNAIALIQECEQISQFHQMLDKVGKGLEILFAYYTGEQEPKLKPLLKQLIRRTKVCGVGYIELGFQRLLEPRPEVQAQIADMSNRIAHIQTMSEDVAVDEKGPGDATVDELKSALATLQAESTIIAREGPTFDFPRATDIIPHRKVRQLKNFLGADYVTREFLMSVDEIKDVYKVDVGQDYMPYKVSQGPKPANSDATPERRDTRGDACVWRVWSKKTGEEFTLCDGYPDYLVAPARPTVQIERFYPLFVLSFNDIEDDIKVYPPSDVYNLRFPQMEYNRARQGLRDHRVANRPKYFARKGLLEDEDKQKLQSHQAHALIELSSIDPDKSIDTLIQGFKPIPIDPPLYETSSIQNDVLLTVGDQSADLGPTGMGDPTATEVSVSQNALSTEQGSNTDDIDELLSDLARATGEVCLLELDPQTATKIIGPGAVWPQLNRQEIVESIYLEVKAGSSGRPNAAAELAKLERAMPYLLQLPGVGPNPISRRYADLLDLDLEDFIVDGLPSIVAMNAMAGKAQQPGQAGTGNPATDPTAQGPAGGGNAQKPAANEPGGQPAYPSITGPLTRM